MAERAFLAALGGGCDAPVGAHAVMSHGQITLTGFLALDDVPRWETSTGKNPEVLGTSVAQTLQA